MEMKSMSIPDQSATIQPSHGTWNYIDFLKYLNSIYVFNSLVITFVFVFATVVLCVLTPGVWFCHRSDVIVIWMFKCVAIQKFSSLGCLCVSPLIGFMNEFNSKFISDISLLALASVCHSEMYVCRHSYASWTNSIATLNRLFRACHFVNINWHIYSVEKPEL